jgi:hypothetical protein
MALVSFPLGTDTQPLQDMLREYMHAEITFHARSLEALTAAYNMVEEIDEGDVEVRPATISLSLLSALCEVPALQAVGVYQEVVRHFQVPGAEPTAAAAGARAGGSVAPASAGVPMPVPATPSFAAGRAS